MFDSILDFLSHGFLPLPWWGYVLVALGLTHVTIAAVTIYLHRHQAHRALKLSPVVAHFFRFWLWLTTGMVTAEWVAIHRKHHAKCETEDDPHSPVIKGIHTVLWRGAELYRDEAGNAETLRRFSQGTPDDWLENHLYRRHPTLGIALMLGLDLALFGVAGLAIWAVQMVWIPFWAAGVINGLGHWWGYRNFESPDCATNISPWGILIGGEELHNNHHAFPGSARLSSKWWEFDIGWFYIRVLEILGLARVDKVARAPVLDASRTEVDGDTLRALIRHRLHVMAGYAREVMLPVLREEWQCAGGRCRQSFRQARRLLLRDPGRVDGEGEGMLARLLARHERIKTVYSFRQRLTELWTSHGRSQEELLAALKDWCRQAEATGIRALAEFARRLPAYRAQPA
ncbi:DesA family fatty acid desaturase [Thiohalobacter sp.]|uniref:DesA family fatty acid desaturase n=1 Tax=Thiohalobacter sp. TaxID=2025948 RepID=UPI0029500100|nr:fatty acid desaturase [Thiohalobacter sp.]